MKIAIVGGGPGGLYTAILIKKANPSILIDVFERNNPEDSFGFGVVFSDETLGEFLYRDPESYELIRSKFSYWDDIIVARDNQKINISGNGFCGCSRKTLLQLLHSRCKNVGVNLHFNHPIENASQLVSYDYIIASDGINSLIREQQKTNFETTVNLQQNKFVWMGSTKPLEAFTYYFRNTPHGPIVAHTYQYEEGMSTWIFECTPKTYEALGFETFNENLSIEILEELFKEELDGHALISNKSHWRQFPHISNKNWNVGNIFLLGDAKATAHFSIGSGTKLAMESAIALADAILLHGNDLEKAATYYNQKRRNKVEMIQYAAQISSQWFENMDRYINQPFHQFAFGVMTRSKKVTFENLALRDANFTNKVLEKFNLQNNLPTQNPAAFSSFKLRSLTLSNRIAMAPMGQYMAQDGIPNEWHFTHYTSRAIGGVGLIITEMTAITENGRITEACTGIYNNTQVEAWKKINQFIHQHTATKTAIQIGHSGPKGNSKIPFSQNAFTPNPNWQLVAASAKSYADKSLPRELNLEDMNSIEQQFITATINAESAGFDMIEIQAHHGFLLASFLSPLTNLRTDQFGGSIENRSKFPLRIIQKVRENFPKEKPISVRISATDWSEGGISNDDILHFAKALKEINIDIINVSTGNTIAEQNPLLGRMWQVPFSDQIKNETNIPTITAGNITDLDQINTIILSGKADLVALGKPILLQPYFVKEAQARENFNDQNTPPSYATALKPYASTKNSEKLMVDNMKKSLKPQSHQNAITLN